MKNPEATAMKPSLVLLACALLLLSGCASEGAPSGGQLSGSEDPGTSDPSSGGPGATGEPDPGSSPAPTQPTSKIKVNPNANFSGAAHQHDWWGTDTQVVIMDRTLKMGPGGVCAGVNTGTPCNQGDLQVHFDPTSDPNTRPSIIFPGTGRMDVKITVGQIHHPFEIGIVVAGKVNSVVKYKVDQTSEAFTLEGINETVTDPPHFRQSSWYLRLYTTSGGLPVPAAAYQGPVRIEVTVFRDPTRSLPVDPPHPDLWGSESTKTLYDGRVTFQRIQLPQGSSSSGTSTPTLAENQTVLSGAAKMRVTIQWTNELVDVSKLALTFCPANGNCGNANALRVEPAVTSESGTRRVYELEVRPDWWDSPYSTRTRWQFGVFFEDATSTGTGAFKGSLQYVIEIEKGA